MKIENEVKEITISLDEYKELLVIKGKYEELKDRYEKEIVNPIIFREPNHCGNWQPDLSRPTVTFGEKV